MASWQAHVAAFLVRRRVRPALGDMSDLARVRAVFDQPLPAPAGVRYRDDILGGVRGEWVEALAPAADHASITTVLYVHGGGFVGCSPRSHRSLTAALALQGLRLFVPDYRLAPEHPFPAAPDDVLAVWHGLRAALLAAGHRGRVAVAGDSAGGNLALTLMQGLRDAGQTLPDAAALFSPATDLSGGSPSLYDNAERDPMFAGVALRHLADAYLGGVDPADPRASPLLGELHGLPPLLLQVGEDESLRDDTLRLADKAHAAGADVALRVVPVVHHVWPMLWRLPESRAAVRAAAQFLHGAPGTTLSADDGAKGQAGQAGTAAGAPANKPAGARVAERFDVLIVGAGSSGISAALQLQQRCPTERYALLEAHTAAGGRCHSANEPGSRAGSDSQVSSSRSADPAIVDGQSMQRDIAHTATARGLDRHIRLQHRALRADWSSASARWTLLVDHDGRPQRLSARFLLLCAGQPQADTTATGPQPAGLGDLAISLDGQPCDLAQALSHRGMMLSGVPNLAYTLGQGQAGSTAEQTAAYVCRLLRHMKRHGLAVATPRLAKPAAATRWQLRQSQLLDRLTQRFGTLADRRLHWAAASQPPA